MFRCENCGKTFETMAHYTESNGFPHPPFEEWDGCPFCGESRPTEVETCDGCGETVDVDDLYYGLCADCLRERCTYDSALGYLQDRDELGPFFCWLLNDGHEPDVFKPDLVDVLAEIYRRRKANDLLTNSTEFLDSVREYILDADGEFGKADFAEYLDKKEGKQ